jgi:hypothetical protein
MLDMLLSILWQVVAYIQNVFEIVLNFIKICCLPILNKSIFTP